MDLANMMWISYCGLLQSWNRDLVLSVLNNPGVNGHRKKAPMNSLYQLFIDTFLWFKES